jgi:hypothetical protein
MLARSKISGALDQSLLGYGVGSGMLSELQDGGGLGQPIADATDDKRFKGNSRDSLAVAWAFVDPSSNDREM